MIGILSCAVLGTLYDHENNSDPAINTMQLYFHNGLCITDELGDHMYYMGIYCYFSTFLAIVLF